MAANVTHSHPGGERRAARKFPAATALAAKLKSQTPPTQANPIQSVLPGNLILDRAQLLAVNNTNAVSGSGATQIAPFCATISYQNTIYYSVPWIGPNAPNGFTVMVLAQPPMIYILGKPSNV